MTGRRPVPRCDRTRGLIDRVVAERGTAEDRAHAGTCDSCGPVILRADRFDDELRRAARGFVAEQLPSGVLDPELSARGSGIPPLRRTAPGLASILAAVVILAVATAVALAPGKPGPGASPLDTGLQFSVPALRAMADILGDVQAMGYSCVPTRAESSAKPSKSPREPRSVECLSPAWLEGATVAIAPVEAGDGKVVYLTISGELDGASAAASLEEVASVMGELASLSISDPEVARDASAFVIDTLPGLQAPPSADEVLVVYGGVRIYVQRNFVGGYRVILQPT